MIRKTVSCLAAACAIALGAAGCGDEAPAKTLAPTATALATAAPAAVGTKKLTVAKTGSKVELMMEAPVEKIHGKVVDAMEGELNVDLSDLTKTTGKLMVDISGIELFQQVKDDKGAFSEEKKEPTQNKHARDWLEIGEDAPEKEKAANARVELLVTKVDNVSTKDVMKMTGAERKVTMTITGDFLLHGRKSTKTADIEATFKFEGDKPASVTVKTTKPFAVGLEEHDVRPRKGFGVLAAKGFEALGQKVAKEAQVSVEFTAGM